MSGASSIRFGIVGCGSIAPTHARVIGELGHAVVALTDVAPGRAAQVAAQCVGSVPRVYDDPRRLFDDREVDAVCVCTPSGLHAVHAIAALEAGQHVLVEKPMDVSVEACDRLIAAADASGRCCSVVSQHRFDAASLLAKRLIDHGRIGRIVLATADVKWYRTQGYYDEADWRGTWRLDGGGALINQGIHTLDLLQWLTGGVASVHARVLIASAHERIEVEDVAVLSLRLRCGAIGSMVASTAAYDGLPARIEIFGTDGSILIEGDNLRRLALRDGQTHESQESAEHAIDVARGGTARASESATRLPAQVAAPGARWGDAHRAQIADFVSAIVENRRPMIDARAGREPVVVAVAAYRSARTGEEVVIHP